MGNYAAGGGILVRGEFLDFARGVLSIAADKKAACTRIFGVQAAFYSGLKPPCYGVGPSCIMTANAEKIDLTG